MTRSLKPDGSASFCRAESATWPCLTTFRRTRSSVCLQNTLRGIKAVLPAETRALLTLHLLPGIGPKLTAALLARFGSAAAVLRASAGQLRQVAHVGEKLAPQIAEALQRIDVDAEIA